MAVNEQSIDYLRRLDAAMMVFAEARKLDRGCMQQITSVLSVTMPSDLEEFNLARDLARKGRSDVRDVYLRSMHIAEVTSSTVARAVISSMTCEMFEQLIATLEVDMERKLARKITHVERTFLLSQVVLEIVGYLAVRQFNSAASK